MGGEREVSTDRRRDVNVAGARMEGDARVVARDSKHRRADRINTTSCCCK